MVFPGENAETLRLFQIPIFLFGLAYLLYLDPLPFRIPTTPQDVPAWATDPSTVRQWPPQPAYRVGQFTYECHECHKMWPDWKKDILNRRLHAEVELRHGINDRCLNCHHPSNRNTFVDDDGNSIPWDSPQLMCAKCHGPVYRDWQHGAHGRTEGYWNTALGKQIKRRCVECHDPHQPPFPPIEPAPGPNTLRMGPQDHGPYESHHDPLHPTMQGRTEAPDHWTFHE
jgi:hypothetical protein